MPKPENLPIGERAKRFLASHGGDAERAIGILLTDLRKYRTRLRATESEPYKPEARTLELESENRELESEVERLSGLVPAPGAVILVGDAAKDWPLYQALGKPADIDKALKELPVIKGKVQEQDWSTAAAEAAKLLGWNEAAALGGLKTAGLVFSVVNTKDNTGKDIKVPHVRPAADEKVATVPLEKWVTENAAYLLPALKAVSTGNGTPAPATGTEFPRQSAEPKAPSTGDVVADFAAASQKARDERPSPFAPRKVAAS